MDYLESLKSLIKRHGGIAIKPTKDELYDTVMEEYSKREPMTDEESDYVGSQAWQMINNFYGKE